MNIKQILLSLVMASLPLCSYASTDKTSKAVQEQARIKNNLPKSTVIYGKKTPEKIPHRVLIQQLFEDINRWGIEKTRTVFAGQMNIGELLADEIYTLADQVLENEKKVKYESDVCKFINSRLRSKKPITDHDMVDYYTQETNKARKLFIDAGRTIENILTPRQYRRLNQYLLTVIAPTMTYSDTRPSDLLTIHDTPLAQSHTECYDKQ